MRSASNAMLAVAAAVAGLPHEPSRFDEGIRDLVQLVKRLLGFNTACALCLDFSTWAVSKAYGDDCCFPSGTLIDDFILELRSKENAISELVLWRNSPPWHEQRAVACVATTDEGQAVVLVGEWGAGFDNTKEDPEFICDITGIIAAVIVRHGEFAAAEQQRRQLEVHARLEALGAFADGMAHEINNVLAAIMGYAEMARDALMEQSAPREYVEFILETGIQTQHMVEQILNFARIRDQPLEVFVLKDTLNEITPDLYSCVHQGTELIVKANEASVALEGRQLALRDVLVNLCKNSTEAMPEGGSLIVQVDPVDVSTSRPLSHGQLSPGRYVKISVQDEGNGIEPLHLVRITEPFYTTKTGGKYGLGLFIASSFVQLFNGAMDITSEPRKGTTVDVFLPCYCGKALPDKPLDKNVGDPFGHGELIAVVDQALPSRLSWEERLALEGYEPIGFESFAALHDWRLRTGLTPDLVLIDVQEGAEHVAYAMEERSDLRAGFILGKNATIPKSWEGTYERLLVRKPVSRKELARLLSLAFKAPGLFPAS